MTAEDGIVNLWDLPEDKIFVKFSEDLQKQMIKLARKIIDLKHLSKKLQINEATFYDFEKSRFSTTLKFVKCLSSFLIEHGFQKFSLENIQKEIILIKTKQKSAGIKSPKFPINFNCEDGARIVAGILFDGGITSGSSNAFYVNNEKTLVDEIVRSVNTVVGEIHHFVSMRREKTYQVWFPQIMGFILVYGLGIPAGKKVFTSPVIPDFLTNCRDEMQKAFLRQVFDDEGSVKKNGCRMIQFTQHFCRNEPPARLLQIKQMLSNLGVMTSGPYFSQQIKTKSGYPSYGWKLTVTNQSNLRAFRERVNFSMERKRTLLNKAVESYLNSPYPPYHIRGTASEEFYKACLELNSDGRKITVKNVSEKAKRSLRYTRRILVRLLKEGKLRITKEHRWNGFGSEPAEFETVDVKTIG